MNTPSTHDSNSTTSEPGRWHIPALICLSTFWESLFILKGSNLLDEGWALYAGMQLGMGRHLYDEISWVFPPGHALPAWLGHALDPQGVVVPRLIYAAFTVALCVSLYLLGRKIMPARFAFLGAALLAVAAPRSHMMHLLYGYRYMVFAVAVLLAYSIRLETGRRSWIFIAGILAGVSLYFRVTPAFAVSVGLGIAVLTQDDMVNIETGIVLDEMLGPRTLPELNRPDVPIVLRVYNRTLGAAVAARFGFENVLSTVELAAP
ncbi:MAG: glycosyltransferase family 39 protein, partial [Myxococcales bacterium]|nr:glycosyltransferase family 39 protein [Myxococcales bacterium]